jgi:hypothetical protein
MFKIQCDLFIENNSCCFCTKLKLKIKNHVNFFNCFAQQMVKFSFLLVYFCKLLNTLICNCCSKKDKKV